MEPNIGQIVMEPTYIFGEGAKRAGKSLALILAMRPSG
jgi:hypothetical protein